MRKLMFGLVVGCMIALLAGPATAQQDQGAEGDQDALTQKWVAFMTPGAEHELLKHKVGKWTVKIEMWTAPGAPVTASEGTSETQLALGGRYLMDTMKSDFQGQPFEGKSITGYDKLKKKFVTIWVDNLGTGFTMSTGTYDKATKSFHYKTMSPDVAEGNYKLTRTVERVVSQDEWVMEMYDTDKDEKEFLMMKAVYKRVK